MVVINQFSKIIATKLRFGAAIRFATSSAAASPAGVKLAFTPAFGSGMKSFGELVSLFGVRRFIERGAEDS